MKGRGILPVVLAVGLLGCGKKGPPLPPLVRVPAAPGDLVAERRGPSVDITFVTPSANTDGSRPADIERVEVYAVTGAPGLSDAELLKNAARVASVEVKRPRDPDAAVGPDEPREDVEPPEGTGADQGVAVRVTEELDAASLTALRPRAAAVPRPEGPLLGPPPLAPPRTYVAVGVSTRGRRGPASARASVSLLPAPPPPSAPAISYDERAVRVTWAPPGAGGAPPDSASTLLPARVIGVQAPKMAFHVYAVESQAPAEKVDGPPPAAPLRPSGFAPTSVETRLTKAPIDATEYVDSRLEWGVERCYTVRAVQIADGLAVESEAPVPVCRTLVDTFAPAPPRGLRAIGSEGAITLIWDRSEEQDLAGYLVLRTDPGAAAAAPVTPAPIRETTLRDEVPPGGRYRYAVQAVDQAGNASTPSTTVEETPR